RFFAFFALIRITGVDHAAHASQDFGEPIHHLTARFSGIGVRDIRMVSIYFIQYMLILGRILLKCGSHKTEQFHVFVWITERSNDGIAGGHTLNTATEHMKYGTVANRSLKLKDCRLYSIIRQVGSVVFCDTFFCRAM